MTELVQTSSEETRPRSSSTLIISRYSFSPWTWAHFQTGGSYSLLWWMSLYVFDILFYHLTCFCYNFYGISALVGRWSSIFTGGLFTKKLTVCPFYYTAFAVEIVGRSESWQRFNHTSRVAIVTPTDRPKSVRNLLCNRSFWWRFYVVSFLFGSVPFSLTYYILTLF